MYGIITGCTERKKPPLFFGCTFISMVYGILKLFRWTRIAKYGMMCVMVRSHLHPGFPEFRSGMGGRRVEKGVRNPEFREFRPLFSQVWTYHQAGIESEMGSEREIRRGASDTKFSGLVGSFASLLFVPGVTSPVVFSWHPIDLDSWPFTEDSGIWR